MWSHRVGHDWSDLAAAAATIHLAFILYFRSSVEFLIFVFIFLISKSFFFCYLKDKLKKTPLISCIRGLYLRILMIVCFDFIFPCSSDSKASAYNAGDPGSIPGSGRSPREGMATPVFLPGETHARRILVGYSPWGCKQLDTTELLHTKWPLGVPSSLSFCSLDRCSWLKSNSPPHHTEIQSSCPLTSTILSLSTS